MAFKKVTAIEFIDTFNSGHFPTAIYDRIVETLRYYDNMSGEKFRAPNLSNATNGFVIDELGTIKAEIKPRQTYEKVLADRLKIQLDNGTLKATKDGESTIYAGEEYQASIKWVQKMIMDAEAVASYLRDPDAFRIRCGGTVTLDDLKKLSEYWEIRCSLKPTEVK